MMKVILLLSLLAACRALPPGSQSITIFDGLVGDWTASWIGDNTEGWYACGAELQVQDDQGYGDDTAVNGLRLTYCYLTKWAEGQHVATIHDGDWGDWKGMAMCPEEYFIDGAQARYDIFAGPFTDDKAMTGLKIRCRHRVWGQKLWVTVFEIKDQPNQGWWLLPVVNDFKYVKLAKVRSLGLQGFFGDDLAVTGLKFLLEPPRVCLDKFLTGCFTERRQCCGGLQCVLDKCVSDPCINYNQFGCDSLFADCCDGMECFNNKCVYKCLEEHMPGCSDNLKSCCPGTECVNDICVAPVPEPCLQIDETGCNDPDKACCDGYQCLDDKCVPRCYRRGRSGCTINNDCCGRNVCSEGVCVKRRKQKPKKKSGTKCKNNAQCESKKCKNGFCK